MKLFDVQTLATFNQQYYLACLKGKVSIEDYLRFAMRVMRYKPQEWMNMLCGKWYYLLLLKNKGSLRDYWARRQES